MTKSVSVVPFVLSADLGETISAAAEMASDATFDFRKACEMVCGVFKPLFEAKDENGDSLLTYQAWETIRIKFEAVAEVRARDNSAIDPKGAASDVWGRIAKYAREFHGLKKPTAGGDAERMAVKREEDAKKALEAAAGRSSQELLEAQMALFAQANPQAIAEARAMDKIIKAVEKIEKDTVDAQMKPLVTAATDSFKAALEHLKATKDQVGLMDLITALGPFMPPKQ